MNESQVYFYVNKDKRTVVCRISGCEDIAHDRLDKYAPHFFHYICDQFKIPDVFVGVAKCAPEDEWDVEYGKKLALNRAKRKRGIAVNRALRKSMNMMRREMDDLWKMGIHDVPDPNEV